jgi:hypothetical protein
MPGLGGIELQEAIDADAHKRERSRRHHRSAEGKCL